MKKQYLASAAVLALCSAPALAEMPFAVGEDGFSWDSYSEYAANHDYAGEVVTITGPWTGNEAEIFDSVVAYFEEATGADVQYSGSDSFEQDIVIATRADSPPNIAVFPQPGLMADLAAAGELTPAPEGTGEWVAENFAAGSSWVDLATAADENGEEQLFGMFYRVDLKSIVWYAPESFEEAGYEIPESMEELIALSEQIVEDGETPWCIGLGSGAATGWPATDWVEDIMLRTQPPETYDAWVSNELPFDSPEVVGAIETFGSFARNGDWVAGGPEAVVATDFRDSPAGMFNFPPDCYMHRQASFIPQFFPEDAEFDFFYFPSFESEDLGNPVLGAGTVMSITEDSEATRGFFEFMQLPLAHEVWMAQGGFLSPHTGTNLDVFGTDLERQLNQILLDATTFRFDASDLMPGEIGAGIFWSGMVDYVTGTDAAEVAANIQARWQEIQ